MNTLPLKFISTTEDNLGSIEITPGAIITLLDKPGLYYDTDTSRNKINTLEFIATTEGVTGEPDTLYFCTGNNVIYYWADGKLNSAIGEVLTSAPTDGKQYVQKNGVWQTLDYVFECTDPDEDGYNLMSLIRLLISSSLNKLNLTVIGDGSGLISQVFRISVPKDMELTLDFSQCSIPDRSSISDYWISNSSNGLLNVDGLTLRKFTIESDNCVLFNINKLVNCELTVSPSIEPKSAIIRELISAHHCRFENCNTISMLMSDGVVDFSDNVVNDTLVEVGTVVGYDDENSPMYEYRVVDHTITNHGTSMEFADLSWSRINRIKQTHQLAEFFAIGDSKYFTISGEPWVARIIDFNHDKNDDGNLFELTLACFMQSEYTHLFSADGEMRYTRTLGSEGSLSEHLHDLIDRIDDVDLKTMIKASVAEKIADEISDDRSVMEPRSFNDYVWPFAEIEVTGDGNPYEGSRYTYFDMIKPIDETLSTNFYYWTRSRSSTDVEYDDFIETFNRNYVTVGRGTPSSDRGVMFGICL